MPMHPPARRSLAALAACTFGLALSGCATSYAPILDPQGPIAIDQRDIMIRAFAIMMIVVLPVFLLAALFAWRYRASNTRARYEPEWESSRIDTITWIVPGLIWITLAFHVWVFTHDFDPYKPLDPTVKPLEVQAVAQDWKWLFIYPEQGIATVNEVAFPSGRPVTFRITSDTVMNAFFIPALGSQIYAMAGMQTQLNLLADRPGQFRGRNTQYSGDGFPDQHFAALSMTEADFDAWVAKVKASGQGLDATAYDALAKPSSKNPVTYYATVEPDLFGRIIAKYDSGMAMPAMDHAHAAAE